MLLTPLLFKRGLRSAYRFGYWNDGSSAQRQPRTFVPTTTGPWSGDTWLFSIPVCPFICRDVLISISNFGEKGIDHVHFINWSGDHKIQQITYPSIKNISLHVFVERTVLLWRCCWKEHQLWSWSYIPQILDTPDRTMFGQFISWTMRVQ